ncbi:unnamed protein product [Dicrocoelium dendriticum]|nr:unnamed protein product [Dicrocoelium dendriticum]
MPRLVNRSSRVSEWVSQELTVHSDCSPVTAHLPWVDSYVPESEVIIDPTERSGGPILLLTGPPGCGKTTALRVLLHSESVKTTHPVSVVEWTDEPVGGDELNHLEQFVSQLGRYGQVNLETDEWHDSSATPCALILKHILDQCQMDGDNFVSWLHENYLDFTPHMTATQWVADRFSWTDAFLSGGMNWRLGLTAAADCNHMQSASYRGTASTGRHYPTVVMSRTLVLSYNMVEESADGGEHADTHLRKGFHQFRSPWATGAWRKAMEHFNTVFDLLCRSQLSSLQVTSVCMTGRKHLLMDWLPLALEVPNLKNCIPCGSLTTLTNSCRLSTPSHSHSRPKVVSSGHITGRPRPNGFSKVDCEDDGWICPMEALLEGAELPIEEDLSDDQFARGR